MNRQREDLNLLLAKAIHEVEDVGIVPGEIDKELLLTNGTSEFGRCTKKPNGSFTIHISKHIVNIEEEDLMEVLVHEVLHSVDGCMNHGPLWRKAADIMNEKKGYNISRTTKSSNMNLTSEHQAILKRYAVTCVGCGSTLHRQRKSKLINYPELYTCGACGGELERIK